VALRLVLRQINTVTGVFMQATAHPDDETNALHVMLKQRYGRGARFSPPPRARWRKE